MIKDAAEIYGKVSGKERRDELLYVDLCPRVFCITLTSCSVLVSRAVPSAGKTSLTGATRLSIPFNNIPP